MVLVRAVVLAIMLAACGPPLGSNDVALQFDSTGPSIPSALVGDVIWNLSVHFTQASVSLDGPRRVRVVIDAAHADNVVRWLTQPGELAIRRTMRVGDQAIVRFAFPHAKEHGKHVAISLDANQVATLLHEPPDEQVEVTWRAQVMWSGTVATGLRVADGVFDFVASPELVGYVKAREEAHLFSAPRLPPLTLATREELPIDWLLVITVLGLPIIVAISWLFFVRRFDRAQPEPWWLLLVTVALGAATTPIAAWLEHLIGHSTPYLDHQIMALDLSPQVFPLCALVFTLVVGCVEEGLKLLAAWSLAMHRREFDEPIDGIVFAAAAAIGFATAENIMYFTHDRLSGGLLTLRSLTCVAGHLMYAAIWGYALGQRLVRPKARVLPYFALAALLHGVWDTVVSFHPPWGELGLMIASTTLFTVLVRRALRWGVVEKAHPGERLHFRFGRRRGFLVAVLATFAFGWRLETIAIGIGRGTARVDVAVIAWLALYGTLFIIAAWAMTALLPLDAVLDDHGLTFAGALRKWSEIRGIKRVDDSAVIVESTNGDVHLRPASKATIDRFVAEIAKRVTAYDKPLPGA